MSRVYLLQCYRKLTLSMQCYGELALSIGIMRSMYTNNVKIKGFFHLQHVTHDQLCQNRNYVQSMNGEEQMDAENIHTHKTFAYNFLFNFNKFTSCFVFKSYAITNVFYWHESSQIFVNSTKCFKLGKLYILGNAKQHWDKHPLQYIYRRLLPIGYITPCTPSCLRKMNAYKKGGIPQIAVQVGGTKIVALCYGS